MGQLPFNTDVMEFLYEHRSPILTPIFKFFTELGEVNGYILVIATIYVAFNKKLGYRMALLAGLTSISNHTLKIIVRNPRPFVTEGTYTEKWAVSNVEETAQSFSTPSGHAMGSASIYSYLYAKVSDIRVRIIAIIMILFIGASRPYLGVHYVEDILLGWTIGLILTFIVLRLEDKIDNFWNSFSLSKQTLIVVSIAVLVWLIMGIVTNWSVDGQEYATFGGFFTGFIIGRGLEKKYVNFDARSGSVIVKIVRVLITVALTIVILMGLSAVFDMISGDDSLLGFILRYIRYTTVALSAIFIAPWVMLKLKLLTSENLLEK